ncbi:MAG: guanylate kinase [Prevotella sp.]|nr:guanylate kinase [Alistipes senegalensis]MCM1357674.1 guanylate kinase [Prevotella sp.]MCM1473259.1 guanylate kinase [Muribaculaceae bacterium]MDE6426079.1 guanylate kinase [Ruminococcus sp.]
MNKGRLIIFSAPSGCGKGTMLKEILKCENYRCSVSATTRQPREGEKNGVNYYFLTREEFEQKINENAFLEYAEYCHNYYGTLISEVDDYLEKGIDVILEIEVQGALKVMQKRPDAISVFIAPPSVKELRRRLKKRGTETAEVIEERVSQAEREISQGKNYNYIIVNDVLENAVDDFFAVMRAERLKSEFSDDIIE